MKDISGCPALNIARGAIDQKPERRTTEGLIIKRGRGTGSALNTLLIMLTAL